VALAQTKSSGQPASSKTVAVASANAVGSSATSKPRLVSASASSGSKPVATIHGICKRGTAAVDAKACTTVLTRHELDTIMDVMAATGQLVLPQMRRQVALGYVDLLAGSEAARKAGADKDPRFAEILRITRMKALSDLYRLKLQEEAAKVSASAAHDYYENNLPAFEQLTLQRIALPMYNSADLKDQSFAARAKKIAADTRERAAKGEDMPKLEKEALEALGVKSPPSTKMGPVRRGMYSPDQEKQLFALKPGQVSTVMEQPSLYIIFKLESRHTLTEQESKDEIRKKLYQQRLEELTKAAMASIHVDYDDEYLGPAPPTPGAVPISPLPPREQAASHN
jgi:hypothetical protein